MKILIILVPLAVSGCAIPIAKDTDLTLFCYRDYGKILPNGMYASNELSIKCNGTRRTILIEHRMGAAPPHIIDFTKHD